MLFFMLYPSMLIVDFIKKHMDISDGLERRLLIVITIALSISIGIFLRF